MTLESGKKDRKTRSDKGVIMATRRDLYCLAWIAEMYAVRVDQVRRLLSRFPDQEKPFKAGDLIAETTLRDQIARWKRAGWIEYQRVLVDMPGWIWPTKKGLALVDLDDYLARAPASTRLDHIYAVNQLRLWMDREFAWKSERRYRREQTVLLKKGDTLGALPDGLITTKDGVVAVEAEISAKKLVVVFEKLVRLVRASAMNTQTLRYGPIFPAIWLYVPNERIKRLVEAATRDLREDEQERVSVAIEHDLIASKFR